MVLAVAAFSVLLVVGLVFLCLANARAIKRARLEIDQRVDQYQKRLEKEANAVVDDLFERKDATDRRR